MDAAGEETGIVMTAEKINELLVTWQQTGGVPMTLSGDRMSCYQQGGAGFGVFVVNAIQAELKGAAGAPKEDPTPAPLGDVPDGSTAASADEPAAGSVAREGEGTGPA